MFEGGFVPFLPLPLVWFLPLCLREGFHAKSPTLLVSSEDKKIESLELKGENHSFVPTAPAASTFAREKYYVVLSSLLTSSEKGDGGGLEGTENNR